MFHVYLTNMKSRVFLLVIIVMKTSYIIYLKMIDMILFKVTFYQNIF